jgi:hypothetical protein
MVNDNREEMNVGLICDPQWAVEHPEEAKALYRRKVLEHLGLLAPEVKAKKPRRTRTTKRKSSGGRGYMPEGFVPPIIKGERMESLHACAKRLGIKPTTVSGWDERGLITVKKLHGRRYVLPSEVQKHWDDTHPPPPTIEGEETITSAEAARLLSMPRRRIGNWYSKGAIRGVVQIEGCHKRLYVVFDEVAYRALTV